MKQFPLVSLIVANWNGIRYLENCLTSLTYQSYPSTEVVFVDNGSIDGSVAYVKDRFPNVKVIELPRNLGFAEANNVGFRTALGEFIILVNNDTISDPGMVAGFVAAMESDASLGAAQGKIRLMHDPGILDNGIGSLFTYTGFLRHTGHMQPDSGYERPQTIFAGKGACLCLRRSALETSGLFDPEFFAYFEDTDLCWRIWLAGYTVAFVPDAEIRHAVGGSVRDSATFANINYHSFKNRIRTLLKNLGTARLVVVIPTHLAICGTLMLIYAMSLRMPLARSIAKALRWNLMHLMDTLRLRRHVQCKVRMAPDSMILLNTLAPIAPRYFLRLLRDYWQLAGTFQGDALDHRDGQSP